MSKKIKIEPNPILKLKRVSKKGNYVGRFLGHTIEIFPPDEDNERWVVSLDNADTHEFYTLDAAEKKASEYFFEKTVDYYMTMYNPFFKHYIPVLDAVQKTMDYIEQSMPKEEGRMVKDYQRMIWNMLKTDLKKHQSDWTALVRSEISQLRLKTEMMVELDKNDRIECCIKNTRAYMALETSKAIGEIPKTIRHLVQSQTEELPQFMEFFYNLALPHLKKLEDFAHAFMTKVDERKLSTFNFAQLNHFMDVIKSNRNAYRELDEYSWKDKSLTKVMFDMARIEEKIRERISFDVGEYNRALEQAEEATLIMEFTDGMGWYHIESSSCDFEAFIAGHCGADHDQTELFSLRSVNEHGFIKAHVTISAVKWSSSPRGLDTGSSIYAIQQVKGNKNSPPPVEYWPYIMDFFNSKWVGWQSTGHYMSETDFRPDWIKTIIKNPERIKIELPWKNDKEKEEWHEMLAYHYEELMSHKPEFHDPSKSMVKYGVLVDQIKNHFTNVYPKVLNRINSDGDVELVFSDYHTMLTELEDWDDKFKEANNDDYYHESYTNHCDYELFRNQLRKDYKHLWNKLKKISSDGEVSSLFPDRTPSSMHPLVEKVRDAMVRAYQYGEEAGYSSARYNAYQRHLNGLVLKNDEGEAFGQIDKLEEGKQYDNYFVNCWAVTIYFQHLVDNYVNSEEISHSYPKFSTGQYNDYTDWDIEWEGDMDYDVARESFDDQMYEQGFRGTKEDVEDE